MSSNHETIITVLYGFVCPILAVAGVSFGAGRFYAQRELSRMRRRRRRRGV